MHAAGDELEIRPVIPSSGNKIEFSQSLGDLPRTSGSLGDEERIAGGECFSAAIIGIG